MRLLARKKSKVRKSSSMAPYSETSGSSLSSSSSKSEWKFGETFFSPSVHLSLSLSLSSQQVFEREKSMCVCEGTFSFLWALWVCAYPCLPTRLSSRPSSERLRVKVKLAPSPQRLYVHELQRMMSPYTMEFCTLICILTIDSLILRWPLTWLTLLKAEVK